MYNKRSIYILAFILFFSTITASAQPMQGRGLRLMQILTRISNSYVDSVDTDELEEEAIVAVLKKLDPHSVFIKKADAKRQKDRLNGSYVGIGVFYNFIDDTATILQPIDGGPAFRAGLVTGDQILKIDSSDITGKVKPKTISKLLRGQQGTLVKLTVARRGQEPFEVELERNKIWDKSIDAAYRLSETIGYVKLNRFSATSYEEISIALEEFKQQGVVDLILDLRNNGGGYLNSVVKITDHFLEENKRIVYTEGVHKRRHTYDSTVTGLWKDGRVVVLINESTASASEILAGAIQDWDRGVIIGRRSYGKGLVQNTFTLFKGDVLRLTIAKYYTPSGRLIQKPYDKGHEAYSHELIERYNRGELINKDSVHFPESDKFHTINSHRPVYAGGGIMPDIFIPMDTLKYPAFYKNLQSNGDLYPILDKYFIEHFSEMNRLYPNFEAYNSHYSVSGTLLQQLKEKNKQANIELEVTASQQEAMEAHIKAAFARNRWSNSEYIKSLQHTDACIAKAIDVLKNPEIYNSKLTVSK